MHELKPNPFRGLLVIVMPTLAALAAAGQFPPASGTPEFARFMDAARLVETAIWVPEALTARTVISFRDGSPVGLLDEIEIPAGYVPVYGMTAEGVALAASEHASRVHAEGQEVEIYQAARDALAEALEVSWRDVDDVTERYKRALTEAAR